MTVTRPAVRHAPSPPAVPPGTPLLGEVVAWTSAGPAVRHPDLTDALDAAGLDPGVARGLLPRHAFARACRTLSDRRIIRPVAETASTLTFQFTAESRGADGFEYVRETLLALDKGTGAVTCPLPGLATLAQDELDRCLERRTGSDVTRCVQRLFDRHADLFPVREAGGCYFVPAAHSAFVDRVQAFLVRLGGRLARFPVPAGTAHGDRSVKEAVACGLAAAVAAHRAAVAGFDADTRADTVARAAERIRTTRLKVEGYAAYLADERDKLERDLDAARRELRAKVDAIGLPAEKADPTTDTATVSAVGGTASTGIASSVPTARRCP